MTCRLDQHNPVDALYDRVKLYPGGVEALAHRHRKSPKVLYMKFEHNNDTHHLRYDEFETFIAWCAAANVPDPYAPLRALCWRFDHVSVHVPAMMAALDSELTQDVLRVAAESGDVARRLTDALKGDGVIDAREANALDVDIEEAIAALVILRDHARASMKNKIVVVNR